MFTPRQQISKTGSDRQLPVTLELLKQNLGISHDEQDEMLRGILESAYAWAEETTNRAIADQEYLLTRDDWPPSIWDLPLGRVTSIVKIEYRDDDGVLQTWDPSEYEADLSSDFRPRLKPVPGESWPSLGSYMASAQVTLRAGWTSDTAPYTIKQGIYLKSGALFGSRVSGDDDPATIDHAAAMMLSAWKLPPW